MLSERTIINALILAAGLIVGPYLTVETFQGNFWPILVAGGVTVLLVGFFFVGDRICALPLLGLCFTGNFNFLPLGFDAADLCTFITILYYLVTYVAIKQKPLKTGPSALLIPIMIIGLIILYHQRSFGIHAFGGTKEGSRPAVLMLACVTCYICGINISNPPIAFLRYLPVYCLIAQFVSGLPNVVTTYVPGSANTLIYLSSNVNLGAAAPDEGMVRQGTMAVIGGALQTVLLAYFPINTWWRPQRWWVAILSLICFWLVAHGGFRSGMAMYGIAFMLCASCYWYWRVLFILPPVTIVLLCLILAQSSNFISLPPVIQRSLSFLPGKWDPEVVNSADSSNQFRKAIKDVYMKEDFAKSPLLGNGFAFDINEYQTAQDKSQSDSSDGYWGTKVYVTGKIFHVGWISVYDAVGIIGTAAFVMLGVSIFWLSACFIFFGDGRHRRSPLLPLRIWIFCNVTVNMIAFFTVFGSFSQTFTFLCCYAIIMAHLHEIEHKLETKAARGPGHALFDLPTLEKPFPVGPLNETNR